MTTCVVAENPEDLKSSFIQAHITQLPGRVIAVSGFIPQEDSRPLLSQSLPARAARKARRLTRRNDWSEEILEGYMAAFRRASVVLAEYGPTGVRVLPACLRLRVPLVVHFHGYDASVSDVLRHHESGYRRIFAEAAAIIAVSRSMVTRLIGLGAPAERTHYIPYGIDCEAFAPVDATLRSHRTVMAAGRFVDKKAPHLTILAFASALKQQPNAKLRMIGDGPLLGACRDLVRALRLEESVEFLGARPHEGVKAEMRSAGLFAQHSVEAQNGDCEGTPVAILEAGASGIPVVATRHAGIVDSVVHEETGLLVDEWDIDGMSRAMVALLSDPNRAERLGAAARARVQASFAQPAQIAKLSAVLEAAAGSDSERHAAAPRLTKPS